MMNGYNSFVGMFFCLLILSGCASFLGNDKTPNNNLNGVSIEKQNAVQELYQLGRKYQDQEQYAEAIEIYEKVLKSNPDFYDAYNGLGVVYSILGEHEVASQLISEAVKLAPLASYLHNNLGYAYMKAGRASEAAGAFQRALQLDPGNVSARSNLLEAYRTLGCIEGKPCGQWQTPEYRQ